MQNAFTRELASAVAFFLPHEDQTHPSALSSWYHRSLQDSSSSSNSFSSAVFWSVNAIWLTVLLGLLLWCWKCGGAERLTTWIQDNRNESDQQFAEVVRARRMQQEEANLTTPEERKKQLEEAFVKNHVKMIVSMDHYVQEKADAAPAAAQEQDIDPVEERQECSMEDASETVPDDPLDEMESGLRHNDDESTTDHDSIPHDLSTIAAAPGHSELDDDCLAVTMNVTSRTSDHAADEELGSNSDGCTDEEEEEEGCSNHLAVLNDYEMDALDAEAGYVVLPNQQGTVPNCCAICLCPYEEGESLIWSSNSECQHAFHEECIVDWLVKMQDGSPCPCCRQPFADLGEPQKKKKQVISWDATRSMDPSVIRLR